MAYNSDGYIMIDFTEVDFRRTNQTIEGLYKRCVDVIGTNKFILVINANGRTPLPATCSFTNNQYVIDTCIYMFAISSNDNLFIRRNDVPASDIIDDSSISVDKTWSSNKIDSELDTKADASALADYQPLLTPVSPISISEDDELSVDLSGKQDTLTAVSPISIDENNNISVDLSDYQPKLTAGDLINISENNVISVDAIKKFKYTGGGGNTRTVTFPTKPKYILSIERNHTTDTSNDPEYKLIGGAWNFTYFGVVAYKYVNQNNVIMGFCKLTYDDTNNILTLTSSDGTSGIAMNANGIDYTVYYI